MNLLHPKGPSTIVLLTPNSAFTFLSISNLPSVFSMSIRTTAFATVTLLRSLTLSLPQCNHHFRCHNYIIRTLFIPTYSAKGRRQLPQIPAFASSSFVEPLVYDQDSLSEYEEHSCSPYSNGAEGFHFENSFASADFKHLGTPSLEVKELDELPEQWRRSKLAWLCKELPAHKPGTLIRLLNAQRKWIRQDDAAYLTVHCLRIRENETAFRELKCRGQTSNETPQWASLSPSCCLCFHDGETPNYLFHDDPFAARGKFFTDIFEF